MPDDSRKHIIPPAPVDLDTEELLAERLAALKPMPKNMGKILFTPEKTRLLVMHRDRGVKWEDLAKTFGICVQVLRREYIRAKEEGE
jgi:hypothetical protein